MRAASLWRKSTLVRFAVNRKAKPNSVMATGEKQEERPGINNSPYQKKIKNLIFIKKYDIIYK